VVVDSLIRARCCPKISISSAPSAICVKAKKIYVDRSATKFRDGRHFPQALVSRSYIDLNRSIGDLHPICAPTNSVAVASFQARHLRDRLDPLFGVAATKSLCQSVDACDNSTPLKYYYDRITRRWKTR